MEKLQPISFDEAMGRLRCTLAQAPPPTQTEMLPHLVQALLAVAEELDRQRKLERHPGESRPERQ